MPDNNRAGKVKQGYAVDSLLYLFPQIHLKLSPPDNAFAFILITIEHYTSYAFNFGID